MKGRKCHAGDRRYADDRECHAPVVESTPQAPNRRLRGVPNWLLRREKRFFRVLGPSADQRNDALGQQP